MSRSVSAPSSVTKTSPCWNGLIVPGSTFRYGSNLTTWTLKPRALSSRPSEAAVMPFPSDETTPPVTKTYFVGRADILDPPQAVELAKAGRPLDQSAERAHFAEDGEAGKRGDGREPSRTPKPVHGLQPYHGPKRIRPGVPQHHSLAEIVGE